MDRNGQEKTNVNKKREEWKAKETEMWIKRQTGEQISLKRGKTKRWTEEDKCGLKMIIS